MKKITWKPHRTLLGLAILSVSNIALAEEKTHNLSIAPQSMSNALKVLADETHIQIFSDGDALKGKQTTGIKGNYTAREALQKLLEGTGLTYTFTADDAAAVKAADSGNDKVSALPAVKVSGKAVYDANDPLNPDYYRSNANTATKTDTSIMETPVSIQVVPQQVLKDQQAITLSDALKNVSGVQVSPSTAYETFVIRGFDTNGSTFRNGIRDETWTVDPANVERLEVLKGPAAVMYGRIEPGGMINRVLKTPSATSYYAVQQQFGSFDLYRTTAEATGALNSDKSLMYRVDFAYQSNNS